MKPLHTCYLLQCSKIIYEVDVVLPILMIRTPRLPEVKLFPQSYVRQVTKLGSKPQNILPLHH